MTSFPFLKISLESGISYGEIIRLAQSIEALPVPWGSHFTIGSLEEAVAEALFHERIRRRQIDIDRAQGARLAEQLAQREVTG